MKVDFLSPVPPSYAQDIASLFGQAWWTRDRTAIEAAEICRDSHTVTAGIREGDDGSRLVAFCRLLTDGRHKAMLMDVIVEESLRGSGLALRLLEHALALPRVRAVEDVELYCSPDLVPFYASLGFSVPESTTFMRRSQAVVPPPSPLKGEGPW